MSAPEHTLGAPEAVPPRQPVDVAVGVLIDAEGRFLMTSRPEGKVYAGYWEFPGGKLEAGESVEAALRRYIAQSSFDPQRTYAERLRRQTDLVQVLRQMAQERGNTDQARTLVRGYLARLNTSPDAAYQRYAQALVEEGCAGFAAVHATMTPAQRLRAVASVGAYEQDFITLAAQRVSRSDPVPQ